MDSHADRMHQSRCSLGPCDPLASGPTTASASWEFEDLLLGPADPNDLPGEARVALSAVRSPVILSGEEPGAAPT